VGDIRLMRLTKVAIEAADRVDRGLDVAAS
jgi:hypothetical protein